MKAAWRVLKRAVSDFLADDAMAWAAAIAFYTALSFAPIILLLMSVADLLGPQVRDQMIAEIRNVIGGEGAGMVDTVAQNAAAEPGGGILPFVISLAVTIFSASGVFGQLQLALNRIWQVRAAPGAGVGGWVRKRLLSVGMIAALAFLLLASLAVSAVLGYILPRWEGFARVGSILVSFVVFVPLFMLMFKFMPDARIAWRDVALGAVITTILFMLGKAAIGIYLGHSAVGSAYGAAGSLIVLLVWVYYSAIILLLGAEITQSRAVLYGKGIHPVDHAQHQPQLDRESA